MMWAMAWARFLRRYMRIRAWTVPLFALSPLFPLIPAPASVPTRLPAAVAWEHPPRFHECCCRCSSTVHYGDRKPGMDFSIRGATCRPARPCTGITAILCATLRQRQRGSEWSRSRRQDRLQRPAIPSPAPSIPSMVKFRRQKTTRPRVCLPPLEIHHPDKSKPR